MVKHVGGRTRRHGQAQGQEARADPISTRLSARSRSRCSRTLAKEYGFELKLYPVAATDMQNQSSLWLCDPARPARLLYIQGWGAMNPTAVKEADKINLPDEQAASACGGPVGRTMPRPPAADAKGYKSLEFATRRARTSR